LAPRMAQQASTDVSGLGHWRTHDHLEVDLVIEFETTFEPARETFVGRSHPRCDLLNETPRERPGRPCDDLGDGSQACANGGGR
jgi:hypothetical protein